MNSVSKIDYYRNIIYTPMIICEVYPSDNNKLLKRAQDELYLKSVGEIFSAARTKFVQADAILNANLQITETAKGINGFDHKALQDAHDIIAATYRYRFDDGLQRDLFEPDYNLCEHYKVKWSQWFFQELEVLTHYPKFVRSVVECVVFENTQLGYMAENSVCDVLITHYGLVDWAYADGYVKTYLPSHF